MWLIHSQPQLELTLLTLVEACISIIARILKSVHLKWRSLLLDSSSSKVLLLILAFMCSSAPLSGPFIFRSAETRSPLRQKSGRKSPPGSGLIEGSLAMFAAGYTIVRQYLSCSKGTCWEVDNSDPRCTYTVTSIAKRSHGFPSRVCPMARIT